MAVAEAARAGEGPAIALMRPPGHHATAEEAMGFCYLNGIAIAALHAQAAGAARVAVWDFDAHHGDGTENLTSGNSNVLTFSIHEKGIFPGTGNKSIPEKLVYNYPLGADGIEGAIGKGDEALLRGVAEFCRLADKFNADLIFIAAGADGHVEDPLSSLQFTIAGYKTVSKYLRKQFPKTPTLIGGAGGYLPDTRTPEVWASFAQEIASLK
jgi:acetoin utilization deacetylase AcuC-like enzyme